MRYVRWRFKNFAFVIFIFCFVFIFICFAHNLMKKQWTFCHGCFFFWNIFCCVFNCVILYDCCILFFYFLFLFFFFLFCVLNLCVKFKFYFWLQSFPFNLRWIFAGRFCCTVVYTAQTDSTTHGSHWEDNVNEFAWIIHIKRFFSWCNKRGLHDTNHTLDLFILTIAQNTYLV